MHALLVYLIIALGHICLHEVQDRLRLKVTNGRVVDGVVAEPVDFILLINFICEQKWERAIILVSLLINDLDGSDRGLANCQLKTLDYLMMIETEVALVNVLVVLHGDVLGLEGEAWRGSDGQGRLGHLECLHRDGHLALYGVSGALLLASAKAEAQIVLYLVVDSL